MSRKKRKLKALRDKEETSRDQNSTRRLTGGLIFSGALNIALATSLIYYALKAKEPTFPYPNSSVESELTLDLSREISLQTSVEKYLNLDFESLVLLLKKKDVIQDGISERDLALSALAFKYDVDVNRALHGQGVDTLPFCLDQNKENSFPLYVGLKEGQYKLIQSFLKTEQWPYTCEGLFNRIVMGQSENSLKNAFYLTKEFMLLEALFGPLSLNKEALLDLMKEGPWSIVKQFVQSKPLVENFSNPLRIHFLCQYLESASEQAANFILKIDPNYALNKLSDEKVVTLLGLLENKSELNQNFALHLALGARSDWVRQEACRLLYHYSEKEFTAPFNYQEALEFLAREYELLPHEIPSLDLFPIEGKQTSFISSVTADLTDNVSVAAKQVYIVQKGDCLSKIAKMHHIDVKELKAANHLDNDLIHVGMTLLIP
ncbi:MAG: hypothetical protein S4CHLAM7_11690 [Chlamydiae bacterium]|nr:hypothetical protein [Chlamydiota bacterium]